VESKIPKPLITFEMANNHMGDVAHGEHMICAFAELCKEFPEFSFAFKLQYRNLDTFIHPAIRDRKDIQHVKRFNETKLSRSEFDRLILAIKKAGFISMVTPFDEDSVEVIEDQGIDIIKIASCAFNDWPLLERVAQTRRPIIASTAGASLQALDAVISYLMHREKDFAILHCVAEYPAAKDKMQLNQIDFLRDRYPSLRIGFSTHEDPQDSEIVKLAVAKGADIFEKHVGLPTKEYSLNAYSASPEQVREWLQAIRQALAVCGHTGERSPVNPAEQTSLHSLRRGAFARRAIPAGSRISREDIYFAFPPSPGQITANDWGKYKHFTALEAIEQDAPVLADRANVQDDRDRVLTIATQVKQLLEESQITVPGDVELEISHHYGLEKFYEFGLTLITVVNRGYCKKLLVCLPNQHHPEQRHQKKEETFHVLYGELHLTLDGVTSICKPGDVINIEPGVKHAFVSPNGAVIEEISSTHFANDSIYTDPAINQNNNRKTILTYWMN
jgi:sialic acid synthase SpsE/mannose-6-phosphate isomerase-like protein (cupin superfamily)